MSVGSEIGLGKEDAIRIFKIGLGVGLIVCGLGLIVGAIIGVYLL